MVDTQLIKKKINVQNVALIGIAFALVYELFFGSSSFIAYSIIGISLCVIGLFVKSIKIDFLILVPLIVYLLISFLSSIIFYWNTLGGQASSQLIFVAMYGLASSLTLRKDFQLKKLISLILFIMSAGGVIFYVATSLESIPGRSSFPFSNPNALGIVLVIGWFTLLGTLGDVRNNKGEATNKLATAIDRILDSTEPWLIAGLTLSLSLGSYLAFAIGIFVYLISRWKKQKSGSLSLKTYFKKECLSLLAKIIFCFCLGMMIYISADRVRLPVLTIGLFAYLAFLSIIWKRFEAFLFEHCRISILIVLAGVICAACAIYLRPSSFATFAERIQMMQNGIEYISKFPLFGIGTGQWRHYNFYDQDIYFNTWHIHNAFIHVGVELGIFAMVCLIVIAIRCFVGCTKPSQLGESSAFLVHMLIDTGFFIPGIVTLFIATDGAPNRKGKVIGSLGTRLLFALCGVMFLDNLIMYIALTG